MTTREQLTFERFQALISMMAQDGATPAGEMPRPGDLEALQQAHELGQAGQVREAHANNNAPPDFAGGGN